MVGKMLPSGETGNGRGRDKSSKRDGRETIDFLCPVANAQYFFLPKHAVVLYSTDCDARRG